jgi:hypothetical protein
MARKLIELFNRDGKVFRRVTQDLAGIRVVTSEIEVSDDVIAYAKLNKGIKIIGYHPTATPPEAVDPMKIMLDDLAEYIADIDSIDLLLRLQRIDPRQGAEPIYESRLTSLLSAEPGLDFLVAEEEEF